MPQTRQVFQMLYAYIYSLQLLSNKKSNVLDYGQITLKLFWPQNCRAVRFLPSAIEQDPKNSNDAKTGLLGKLMEYFAAGIR